MRWGFLGAGWIATRALAPAVHSADGAVLQAVASRSAERAAALEPRARVHSSYDELLDDETVDAVYISLANDSHLPWTLRALEAGKHVLCEKPLGLTAGEVRRMADASRAAGRLLVEASWYRWHPRVREAERLLTSGALGEVRAVRAGFCADAVDTLAARGDYRLDPAMGGGALYDVGCYAVSGALWSLGWPDELAVVAVDVRRGTTGVDLTTHAVLEGAGARATVSGSFEEPAGQWLVVEGSEGTLELPGESYSSWVEDATVLHVDGREVASFEPVDAYRLMVEDFSRAVRGDRAWLVPLEESRAVAEAMDAIRCHPGPGGDQRGRLSP